MPIVQSPGGSTFNPEAVGVLTVNPSASSNSTSLSEQPRTIAQATEEAAIQVKVLPHAINSVADLPVNAVPGMMFTSRLNSTAIYFLGYDNVWRAWALTAVTG